MLQPSWHKGYIAVSQHLHNHHHHHENNLSTKRYICKILKVHNHFRTLSCFFVQYKFFLTGKNWICFAFYTYFVRGTNVSNISEKVFLQNFFRAICLLLHFITKVATHQIFFSNYLVDCTELVKSNTQVLFGFEMLTFLNLNKCSCYQ